MAGPRHADGESRVYPNPWHLDNSEPQVNWIDVLWPMMAAANLTLGFIHLLIWLRQTSRYESIAFFALVISVAFFAAGEWILIRAHDPKQYGEVLRWMHIAVFTGEISIVAFVRLHLRAGRDWLFWTVCVARAIGLLLNFSHGANLNYLEVTEIRRLQFWGGETVSVPIGIVNPLQALDEFINILLLLFLADASWAAWRRGDPESRRRAAVVGGTFMLFFLLAAGHVALLYRGFLQLPVVVTPTFLCVVLVVAYELGRDVLRAVQLTDRLRESEQRMDLAADAADLALWEWDVLQDEIWTTDHGRSMCAFSPSERITLARFLDRVHPDDREQVQGAIAESLKRGTAYEREYRLLLQDGTIRWVRARGRVELNGNGVAALMRGVMLDISAHKQIEENARRLQQETSQHRNTLAHLSRVSTLGELSGALAHELNQPLAAILSNAQAAQRLLARGPGENEKIREILADIVKSDRRAGDVIRRMRALLRKEETHHQLLDMNEVVQEVLGFVRSDLIGRRIACRAELAENLPMISGDRVQLQQVVLNLIVNGCDAMEGRVEDQLIVRTEAAAGGVQVSVIDHGGGIATEELERIFEPFITTKANGMGLGLAVCRTIIQAHGGNLQAKNNASRGATVMFTLPCNPA